MNGPKNESETGRLVEDGSNGESMSISATATSSATEWEELLSRTFVPVKSHLPVRGSSTFHGTLRSVRLGTTTLTFVEATETHVLRTPALIDERDPETYKVALQISGTCVVEQGGRQAKLKPGDLTLHHTSRPYSVTATEPFAMAVLMLPAWALPGPANQVAQLTGVRIDGSSGLGALVAPILRASKSSTVEQAISTGTYVGDALTDLVTAVVVERLGGSETGWHPRHQELASRIRQYVESHLQDPDLDLPAIAAAHHVSVRHLQKVFESEGCTVTSLVRSRRLERCRRDLANPAWAHLSIAGVAARWGFLNAAHFSRLFAASFGLPPNRYRLQHRDAGVLAD